MRGRDPWHPPPLASGRARTGPLARPPAAAPECGQASIELLGAIPGLLMFGFALFQLLAAGFAGVMAGHAAEAGALALAGGRDPVAAARDAVPGWSRARMRVAVDDRRVRVTVRPPSPIGAVASALEVEENAAVAK